MELLHNKFRLAAIAYILFVIGATAFLLFTWGETLYRTAFVISHVVPGVPKWFESGKHEVKVQEIELPHPKDDIRDSRNNSSREVYIYLPQDAKRSAFVIFIPGFTPEGALDSRLVNLANSFAGAGIGVAVPDSQTIRKKTFSRDDINLIKDTFLFLQGRPYVDRERIGIGGFSIAGSYALCAASKLGNDPLFVLSIGGYFNLRDLLIEVLSESAVYNGEKRLWKPDSLPKEVVFNSIAHQMGKKEAHELFPSEDLTFHEAEQFIKSSPQEFLHELDELSPSSTISQIKSRVFLMHDKNDNVIPVEESRKIRDALPKNIPISYNEFSILRHVTPKTFLTTDILKFSWQVLSIVKLLI